MTNNSGRTPTAWTRWLTWWRGRRLDMVASDAPHRGVVASGNGERGSREGVREGAFNSGDGNGGSTGSRALIVAPRVGAGFRNDGRQLGCVLIHGLSSTPESMRALGRALADGGIHVEGVCLPGHGTEPEALESVGWRDWDAAVRAAVRSMRARCERVFVCGQSLGGTLALHAAAHERVDGVVTLAAVLYLRDWRVWLLPVLKRVMRWRHSPGNDIAKPGVCDEGSYDRMPVSAIDELLQLAARVRDELPQIRVPALIMHGTQDHVAPAGNADVIYEHIGSAHKEILRLRRSFHVISLDYDFDLVVDRTLRFMRKVGFESTAPR